MRNSIPHKSWPLVNYYLTPDLNMESNYKAGIKQCIALGLYENLIHAYWISLSKIKDEFFMFR